MAKFRKKPVVIEAIQYLGDNLLPGVCECDAARDAKPISASGGLLPETLAHIHTLEGPMLVSHGDWIITGVKGEKYPCKPDIFEATYERVSDLHKVSGLEV